MSAAASFEVADVLMRCATGGGSGTTCSSSSVVRQQQRSRVHVGRGWASGGLHAAGGGGGRLIIQESWDAVLSQCVARIVRVSCVCCVWCVVVFCPAPIKAVPGVSSGLVLKRRCDSSWCA